MNEKNINIHNNNNNNVNEYSSILFEVKEESKKVIRNNSFPSSSIPSSSSSSLPQCPYVYSSSLSLRTQVYAKYQLKKNLSFPLSNSPSSSPPSSPSSNGKMKLLKGSIIILPSSVSSSSSFNSNGINYSSSAPSFKSKREEYGKRMNYEEHSKGRKEKKEKLVKLTMDSPWFSSEMALSFVFGCLEDEEEEKKEKRDWIPISVEEIPFECKERRSFGMSSLNELDSSQRMEKSIKNEKGIEWIILVDGEDLLCLNLFKSFLLSVFQLEENQFQQFTTHFKFVILHSSHSLPSFIEDLQNGEQKNRIEKWIFTIPVISSNFNSNSSFASSSSNLELDFAMEIARLDVILGKDKGIGMLTNRSFGVHLFNKFVLLRGKEKVSLLSSHQSLSQFIVEKTKSSFSYRSHFMETRSSLFSTENPINSSPFSVSSNSFLPSSSSTLSSISSPFSSSFPFRSNNGLGNIFSLPSIENKNTSSSSNEPSNLYEESLAKLLLTDDHEEKKKDNCFTCSELGWVHGREGICIDGYLKGVEEYLKDCPKHFNSIADFGKSFSLPNPLKSIGLLELLTCSAAQALSLKMITRLGRSYIGLLCPNSTLCPDGIYCAYLHPEIEEQPLHLSKFCKFGYQCPNPSVCRFLHPIDRDAKRIQQWDEKNHCNLPSNSTSSFPYSHVGKENVFNGGNERANLHSSGTRMMTIEEERNAFIPPNPLKQRLCSHYQNGGCFKTSQQCSFAHGEEDLWCYHCTHYLQTIAAPSGHASKDCPHKGKFHLIRPNIYSN
eukprot:TRINITY_DN1519_c0_g3_i1.p1 TRINITY_DN1519_c0_g3~~TRINITY_DN1519_c0_g3_i1.p1  ORF type:complete len:776 (-),score=384.47 TRINITY_DN1519_c0_g3_i1:75-2402(-)